MGQLLTSNECLAKAAEMNVKADRLPHLRAEYADMAACWRFIAVQAKWQDDFAVAGGR